MRRFTQEGSQGSEEQSVEEPSVENEPSVDTTGGSKEEKLKENLLRKKLKEEI